MKPGRRASVAPRTEPGKDAPPCLLLSAGLHRTFTRRRSEFRVHAGPTLPSRLLQEKWIRGI